MKFFEESFPNVDPEAVAIYERELKRQQEYLIGIPSENYASQAVLSACGTLFSNKYAEGYPKSRYYHGCEAMDDIETLAINRAKTLFGAEHANVQPHSGSQANQATFLALLQPGDTVLGMSLDHGGHLSHGLSVNFSGRFYRCTFYGVDRDTEQIDYAQVAACAEKEKPKLIIVGASAYPRTLDFQKFKEIADRVGAFLLADIAHIAGLVAAGCHPDPVPYAQVVTTTTHKTLRGPRSGLILCRKEYAKKIDRAIFPGLQGGPFMHIIFAKAICFFEAMQESFQTYQEQILKNCKRLAATLQREGLRLVSGGTDNHLLLVDLRSLKLNGQEAADLLQAAHITVNKNMIPYDPGTPVKPSGIRLGTPAMTSRGLGEEEMEKVGELIAYVLKGKSQAHAERAAEKVQELLRAFPIYPFLETRV